MTGEMEQKEIYERLASLETSVRHMDEQMKDLTQAVRESTRTNVKQEATAKEHERSADNFWLKVGVIVALLATIFDTAIRLFQG